MNKAPFQTGFYAGIAFGATIVFIQFVLTCVLLIGIQEHWWRL